MPITVSAMIGESPLLETQKNPDHIRATKVGVSLFPGDLLPVGQGLLFLSVLPGPSPLCDG